MINNYIKDKKRCMYVYFKVYQFVRNCLVNYVELVQFLVRENGMFFIFIFNIFIIVFDLCFEVYIIILVNLDDNCFIDCVIFSRGIQIGYVYYLIVMNQFCFMIFFIK